MTQKITVTIDTDGSVRIAVSGCAGPGCKQLTADLERALGAVVKDETTPEFFRQPLRAEQAQGGG